MMIILLNFFEVTQQAWVDSANRSMIYENARVAFDLIERDLQSAYYEEDYTPFWHKAAIADIAWGSYRNESLAFISTTNAPPHGSCDSKYYEVKYQLYYAASHFDTNDGWLQRSVTGDQIEEGGANTKWNYYGNFTVDYSDVGKAFTGNNDSSDAYDNIIPYVTELTFGCLKRDGTVITPDSTGNVTTEFPYSIVISITLMDRYSFKKWQELDTGGAPNATIFKKDHSTTFRRTVLLGERGQDD